MLEMHGYNLLKRAAFRESQKYNKYSSPGSPPFSTHRLDEVLQGVAHRPRQGVHVALAAVGPVQAHAADDALEEASHRLYSREISLGEALHHALRALLAQVWVEEREERVGGRETAEACLESVLEPPGLGLQETPARPWPRLLHIPSTHSNTPAMSAMVISSTSDLVMTPRSNRSSRRPCKEGACDEG